MNCNQLIRFLVFLLLPSFAFSDIPLSMYRSGKNTEVFKSYMTGVGRGIIWANAVGVDRGHPKLFCIPEALVMHDKVILSLLEQEIRNPSINYTTNVPLELVLTYSFIRKFPCV